MKSAAGFAQRLHEERREAALLPAELEQGGVARQQALRQSDDAVEEYIPGQDLCHHAQRVTAHVTDAELIRLPAVEQVGTAQLALQLGGNDLGVERHRQVL